jgi:MFS family permease
MGRVTSVWGLTVLTAFLWFFGGMGLVLIGILTGLSAGVHERGKIFGVMGLAGGLGALIGGMGVGWLVNRWGYPTMFSVVAVFLLIGPLSALFTTEKECRPARVINTPAKPAPGAGRGFYLLFSSTILTSMAGFFVVLIRSILMDDLKFSPLEISITGAIGGLVAMPFPFIMGWFSDRVGRKKMIFTGYLTSLFAMITLAVAKELWQFGLAVGLIGISTGTNNIGNALVNDLVPKESLGKSMSIYGSAAWIGGIAGFALAGVALQYLGLVPTLVLGGCMVVASVALITQIKTGPRKIQQPASTKYECDETTLDD